MHVGVYVLFVCAAGAQKKGSFLAPPFPKKKTVILSLPLNAAEIYEIGKTCNTLVKVKEFFLFFWNSPDL